MSVAPHYTTGTRFGRLTILERAPRYKVVCQCDCGEQPTVSARALKYGATRSCGCLHSEQLAARNRTHGQAESRTYRIWSGMLTRCTNPNRREFKWYGGAGIRVCHRWQKFENFLADMGEAPPELSIERRDTRGDYCAENCYWATDKQQADNRTDSIRLTYDGETLPLTEWASRTGVAYGTLKSRIRLGWPVQRILTAPKRGSST